LNLTEIPFNYILMKMGYTEGESTQQKIAIVTSDMNIKVLVGEYKILLDRIMGNMPLTRQEYDEHIQMIKKWEADLYGS